LDQEEGENGANLTRGSLATMGRRSSRASATGRWDRGLARRAWFRPWFGGEKRGPGHGILVRAVREAREDEKAGEAAHR
jgi:hypothetical protein